MAFEDWGREEGGDGGRVKLSTSTWEAFCHVTFGSAYSKEGGIATITERCVVLVIQKNHSINTNQISFIKRILLCEI